MMKSTVTTTLSTAALVVMLIPAASLAQVTRIDLQVVESPALDGERFGQVGHYERLRGTVYGAVDPADPRHREIVNLDQAPRNVRGRVEYSTTVEIYRPVDMSRWNRTLYHTVPNRGGRERVRRHSWSEVFHWSESGGRETWLRRTRTSCPPCP